MDLELVEQPCAQQLLGDARAAADRDVLLPGRRTSLLDRALDAVVTNVKVVPSFTRGSRGWWVSTNTGTRNGGSSPHQPSAFGSSSQGPSPPLNMRRPISTAPA